MTENWKEKYEYLEKDNEYLRKRNDKLWDPDNVIFSIILIVTAVILIYTLILFCCGVFDDPIDKLNIDKDELVKGHVIKYYPEYKDCNIQYGECVGNSGVICIEGVKIYCNQLENRDGLRVSTEIEPTEVLYFDDITLEDILLNKLKENENK